MDCFTHRHLGRWTFFAGKARSAQWALVVTMVGVLACGGIEPGTTTVAATSGSEATASGSSDTAGGSETGVPASCECFDSPFGLVVDDCAAGTDCGAYGAQPESEWECNDSTEGPDIDVEANEAVVQCILDAVEAAQPFQFQHDINYGRPSNCSNRYSAFPDGELHVIASEQEDLCFSDVTSIKSGFDLSACAGTSGAEGWDCIEAAIASASAGGTCWEEEHCES
jgi:hypothetical protein